MGCSEDHWYSAPQGHGPAPAPRFDDRGNWIKPSGPASDELAMPSRWKRIDVWLNLAMGKHCTRFAQQLPSIRNIAQKFMVESELCSMRADFQERARGRLNPEG